MLEVDMGSSADVGSSNNNTSGRMAMARAMQSLCCCPPERNVPFLCNESFTSFHKADLVNESSTIFSFSDLGSLMPLSE